MISALRSCHKRMDEDCETVLVYLGIYSQIVDRKNGHLEFTQ